MTTYKVTTEGDCEGRTTKILGYATGNPADIKEYYDDQKQYEIRLEAITIVSITDKSAIRKRELLEEKQKLEARLAEIKMQL